MLKSYIENGKRSQLNFREEEFDLKLFRIRS